MKVYELMNMLSEANAGADVNITFTLSERQFLEGKGDVNLRCFVLKVDDVIFNDEWDVSINA
ncbi:MAG: hypothetical protein ACLRP9_01625 [Anaerovoracaceae bacterium]